MDFERGELHDGKPAARRPWTTPVLVVMSFEEIAGKDSLNTQEVENVNCRPS